MKLDFENFQLETVVLGTFRLDGGAMFGSVPKNLWSKSISADEQNCIPLTTRSLLVSYDSRKILVDVGLGKKWNAKQKEIFNIKLTPDNDLPYDYNDITDVILTHLHFDHSGGVSYWEDEQLKSQYPNATFHVQKSNLENALNPSEREAASYLKENVLPVKNGTTNTVNGNEELLPGLKVELVNGHTKGLQWVLLEDDKKKVAFPSDLVPTAHHVPLPFIMGYDMCAETALKEKINFLKRAHQDKWLIVYQHDIETACSYVDLDSRGRYVASNKLTD